MMKQCINLAKQENLLMSALLKDHNIARPIHEFTHQDVQKFGKRAAYVTQIRAPLPTNSLQPRR